MVFLLICKSSSDNRGINRLCSTIIYTFSFAFPALFLHLGLTHNGFRCTEIEILCNTLSGLEPCSRCDYFIYPTLAGNRQQPVWHYQSAE